MALNSPEFRKLIADARATDEATAATRAQEAQARSRAFEARRINVAERIASLRVVHRGIQRATQRTATLAQEVTELAIAWGVPADVVIRPGAWRRPIITGWLLGQQGTAPGEQGRERRRDYNGSFLGTEGLLYDYVFYSAGPPHKWRLPRIVQDGGEEEIIEAYGDDTLKTRFIPHYKEEVLCVATTFLPGEPDTWMPEYPVAPKPRWFESANQVASRHTRRSPEIYRQRLEEAETTASDFIIEYTQASHEVELARFVVRHDLLAE
jgi:hypothetical protein